MSIGSQIYSYRNNFSCKSGNKFPKKRKYVIRLIDILRPGFRKVSQYDDDLFVSICQWLMKQGYPFVLSVNDKTDNIDEFLQDSLFSIDPYHYQNLRINARGFDLFEWRGKFDLFSDTTITGLNFYRNRASMPLPDFTSFDDIKKIIFTNKDQYNNTCVRLKYSFNSCWKSATWILRKECLVTENSFTYRITYGCRDDYYDSLKGRSCSSWSINIESEPDENYIDFCLRIYKNYDKIISGDKNVLISEREGKLFYLGGNFKLR